MLGTVGEMKRGRLVIPVIALLVVAVLIVSGLSYLDLSNKDAERGGRKVDWTFGVRDPTGYQAYFILDSLGPDGMLYGTVSSASDIFTKGGYLYDRYIIAIDPDGTLNWSAGTNAGAVPTMAQDGNFYYIDWPFKPWNSSSDYLAGWYNLTSIDHSGHFRWDYLMNGTMDIWGIFPDGLVVLHHYNNEFNYTLNRWVTLVDEVVGIANGSLMWRFSNPLPDYSFTGPQVNANGTFTVRLYTNDTFAFTIAENGSQSHLEKVQYYVGPRFPKSSTVGSVQYEIRKVAVNNQTMVTSVYAINLTDGTQVWRTILGYSDNPSHQDYGGGWEGGQTFVDASGTIFCSNLDGNRSYALDLKGNILWKGPNLGGSFALYPGGGVLTVDSSSIRKINADGSTAWRYEATSVGTLLVSENGTIYYTSDPGVNALVFSNDNSGFLTSVAILVIIDAVVVSALLLFARRLTRTKQSRP